MNKTAIKNFAIWARNKLRADITLKAGLLGITDKGIVEPSKQSTDDLQIFDIGTSQPVQLKGKTAIEQRKSLVAAIRSKNLKHPEAFDAVIEEVAYTWFNRLIAVRFMEVNDYLPSRVRVLSSENPAKAEPDFVTNPFDTDLVFTPAELDLIDDLKDHNKSDELFQFLFIKQCNKLNEILPELFEKTNDYTELLLNVSFTDKDGVVWHLVHDISEDDFNIEKEGQVEIIGWLYQYYNTEPKDTLINAHKKYRKGDIPFVTQLFTSEWIVKYLVDNSLGRYWIERNPNSTLKKELKFYIKTEREVTDFEKKEVTEIKVYDPCMGSGHFLVYSFDIFMKIYKEIGYTERDAAQLIVKNNLYGLDIDNRATQLSYFSTMMKARSYDRRFLTRGIRPNLYSIQESNCLNTDNLELFGELKQIAQKLVDEFIDAKECGSILNLSISSDEIAMLENKYSEIAETIYDNIFDASRLAGLRTTFIPLLKQAMVMLQKNDIICTNPPYLNSSYMPNSLKDYVNKNYSDFKSDLFAVFINKTINSINKDGYLGILTPYVWMFISSYEKLREYVISNSNISTLVQLEYNAFEAACVPVCAFVMNKSIKEHFGEYIRLSDFRGVENQEPKTLYAINNPNCGYRYRANNDNFSKILGSPIAYWTSDIVFNDFEKGKTLGEFAYPKQGLASADNNRFLKWWFEVSYDKISFNAVDNSIPTQSKWYPHNKGGEYRKWYGNRNYIINWEHNGLELRNFKGAVIRNPNYYFKELTSYSDLTNGNFSLRYYGTGFVFDSTGPSIFNLGEYVSTAYLMGVMNSKVINISFLKILCPTMHYTQSAVAKVPILLPDTNEEIKKIERYSEKNISISKTDWDSFENSWDFEVHPFIRLSKRLWDCTSIAALMNYYYNSYPEVSCPLELCFMLWQGECNERFNQLKANEEELNRVFIDIYGLQDELTPDVEDKDVTVRKAYLQRDMRSFVSYAVGCMFGRYSLNTEGLAYAGGDWNSEMYTSFIPDKDNCIPITDTAYFEDDIVGRFCEFVKVVFGEDTLEVNLEFVAKALGNKGNTSRDIIRNYFLNDFFKDHCKIYQKRPIYWLFDSGKHNGFKALVYMHRWNADTIGNMRVEYLHRIQRTYEKEIEREQDTIDNTTNNRDRAAASKRKEKLVKQLKEAKDYDAKVAHLALSRPDIDLDDGVKVNYEKVQTAPDGKKLQILAKI